MGRRRRNKTTGPSQAFLKQVQDDNIESVSKMMEEGNLKELLLATDAEGSGVLHKAAGTASVEMLKLLENAMNVIDLDGGTTTVARKQYSKTPLHEAAIHGNVATASHLLSSSQSNIIDYHTTRGRTALMYATRRNDVPMVTLLLKAGANVNAVNENGVSSVYVASRDGHIEVLKVLLNAPGVNVTLGSHNIRHTPVLAAVRGNHVTVVSTLLRHTPPDQIISSSVDATGVSVWHEAAGIGSVSMLQCLQQYYSLSNMCLDNVAKRHPIHYAAIEGALPSIKFLANLVGNVNDIRDNDNCTALYYACANGHADVVAYLLKECNADPNICSIRRSPLHCAIEWKRQKCIDLLIAAGADLHNTVDIYGKTASDLLL